MLGALRYSSSQARVRARRSWLLDDHAWALVVGARDLAAFTTAIRESRYGEALGDEPSRMGARLLALVPRGERSLTRSLGGGARRVFDWYVRRFEVLNLKAVIRALSFEGSRERARAVLMPLDGSSVDWHAVSGVTTVAALIEVLRPTPFARPLEEALDRYRQEQLPFHLEVSLDLAYFERLHRLIDRLHGRDRDDARQFLGRWIELQNLLWAFRYRVFSRMKPEQIVGFTLHRAGRVSVAAVQRIATGSPLADEAARLGLTVPADLPEQEQLVALERLGLRALLREARAVFRTSVFRFGAVLAYALLVEAEVRDLATLVGAVLRSVPNDRVRPFLLRES